MNISIKMIDGTRYHCDSESVLSPPGQTGKHFISVLDNNLVRVLLNINHIVSIELMDGECVKAFSELF